MNSRLVQFVFTVFIPCIVQGYTSSVNTLKILFLRPNLTKYYGLNANTRSTTYSKCLNTFTYPLGQICLACNQKMRVKYS